MDKIKKANEFFDLDVWYLSPIKYLAEVIEMESGDLENEKTAIFAMQIQKLAGEMSERINPIECKEPPETAAKEA